MAENALSGHVPGMIACDSGERAVSQQARKPALRPVAIQDGEQIALELGYRRPGVRHTAGQKALCGMARGPAEEQDNQPAGKQAEAGNPSFAVAGPARPNSNDEHKTQTPNELPSMYIVRAGLSL
jgi:hypothetical protein